MIWLVKWTDGKKWTHYLPARKPQGRWGVPQKQAKRFTRAIDAYRAAVKWLDTSIGQVLVVKLKRKR